MCPKKTEGPRNGRESCRRSQRGSMSSSCPNAPVPGDLRPPQPCQQYLTKKTPDRSDHDTLKNFRTLKNFQTSKNSEWMEMEDGENRTNFDPRKFDPDPVLVTRSLDVLVGDDGNCSD